jgi:hypothetical protein
MTNLISFKWQKKVQKTKNVFAKLQKFNKKIIDHSRHLEALAQFIYIYLNVERKF